MAKPTRLHYTGKMIDRGDGHKEPDRFYYGVPARNLTEDDLASMDAETLKRITGGDDPLYVDPDADKPEEPKAEKAEAKPEKKG